MAKQFGGRMFSHEDHQLLERILEFEMSNATALADLQAAVAALQAAGGNVPTDISAGVETEVGNINAVTTSLGGTPPAASAPAPAPAPTEPAPAEAASAPAVAAPAEEENPTPDPNPPG